MVRRNVKKKPELSSACYESGHGTGAAPTPTPTPRVSATMTVRGGGGGKAWSPPTPQLLLSQPPLPTSPTSPTPGGRASPHHADRHKGTRPTGQIRNVLSPFSVLDSVLLFFFSLFFFFFLFCLLLYFVGQIECWDEV